MEKGEMILLRQAKKQERSLVLRQKWGAGKGKEFLGKYFLGEKNTLKAITHCKVLLSPY